MCEMYCLMVLIFQVRYEYWKPMNKRSTRAVAKLKKPVARKESELPRHG